MARISGLDNAAANRPVPSVRAHTAQSTPRVSVLLPARNAESTLARCLESLAGQTETLWECVLVEDDSSDATREIASRFLGHDPRLRIVPGPGQGIVAALRAGLAECRAPLIARMDADDWMYPERLAAQVRALEEAPALSGVGCHVQLFPQLQPGTGRADYGSWLRTIRDADAVRREAFVECPLAHPTWMFRREIFERHPYRAGEFPEDYDLLLRVLGAGGQLGVVPRPLLAWRDTPGRLSRTHPSYCEKAFSRCKAEHLAAGFLAGCGEYILWGYGATGRRLRSALAQRGHNPSHIVELHPRRLGKRIHGAPVIPPDALRRLRGQPIVTSVTGAAPRSEIRAALGAMGFVELRDFVCAA